MLHRQLNFGLACLLALLYIFSENIRIASPWLSAGRMHPLLLHLPIGLLAALAVMHFSHAYDEGSRNKKMAPLWQWSATASLGTALAGMLLAAEPGAYQKDAIYWHMHLGTLSAGLIYLSASLYGSMPRLWQHILLAANVIAITIAGHLGAEITHGKNFLFPKTTNQVNNTPLSLPADQKTVYAAVIQPILQAKCTSCHNPSKSKGDFIMTDTLLLLKGGKNGPAIRWGKPEASLLCSRIHLPDSHEEHMPPLEKPQLNAEEKKILSAWIEESTSFASRLSDVDTSSALYASCKQHVKTADSEKPYSFAPAEVSAVKQLNTFYRSVRPVHSNSPALHATWLLASEYNTRRLKELEVVSEQITSLQLAGMPVTDEDLTILAKFKALEKLNISGSKITSRGLGVLAGLANLRSLSLANTQVDATVEKILKQFPSLQVVYIGQTRVSQTTADKWQKASAAIKFVMTPSIPEKIKLSAPILKNEYTIIKKSEPIELKHFIKGANIYFTTDGTMPDTLNGRIYSGPFTVAGSCDIRAIAAKEGWLASDEVQFSVFERGTPPPHCTLLTEASAQYPGQKEKTFTNGEQAPAANLRDQNWIAFRDKPFHGLFRYDKATAIKKISFSYAQQIPQYVFPPVSVRILAGNRPDKLQEVALQKLPAFQPGEKEQIASRVLHFTLPGDAYAYYKIEAANLPVIPKWHPGKGEKGWLFIDEIFFYE